ncbi:hypothetical protein VFPPC_15216 [Pochonia chlamydosporia 170]|uniref:Uncharacterized protein n=1 Tax=Pochonia chlamydosporia 170 TaxID=1380566 RepID=A0A179G6V1_METCM|nr:hypothetical protein VFPPC_15216 [Pochonia chlamydosporia 170]OAQ72909.1 hypothetical protein VFPPC_15216 [Pochonia chlamydosporia 170]
MYDGGRRKRKGKKVWRGREGRREKNSAQIQCACLVWSSLVSLPLWSAGLVWSGLVWSVWSTSNGPDIDHLSRQLMSGLVGSETSRCKAKLVKSGGFNAAGCWLMVAAIIDPCATSWNMSSVWWSGSRRQTIVMHLPPIYRLL